MTKKQAKRVRELISDLHAMKTTLEKLKDKSYLWNRSEEVEAFVTARESILEAIAELHLIHG